MRIGLVVTGGVDRSGRERVIPVLLSLIERLARRHDLHVFALHHEDRPARYALLGATVHDLGTRQVPRGWRRIVQYRRLLATVRALPRFDVLHAYWGLPAGWVATAAGRRLTVPVIVTANSGEWTARGDIAYGLQRRWIDRRAVATAMRRAARVTVCTRFMEDLATRHGVRAEVVPVGVPRVSHPDGAHPAGPPWRLLHVASLKPVKDQATLLRALARLRVTHPGVHLDIAGVDTTGGALARLAGTLGVERHVTFHGFLTQDRLAPLWASAHLHVVSSVHEASGVATLEAADAGVATVGTHVGYVADWAPDAAVSVPVGDAEALAAALADLLDDAARRAHIARQAQIRARLTDADWTAETFDRLYREVAHSGTSTPGSASPAQIR